MFFSEANNFLPLFLFFRLFGEGERKERKQMFVEMKMMNNVTFTTFFLVYRLLVHWTHRDFDATIKAYNMDLQKFSNSKLPVPVLAFLIKQTYWKKTGKKLKAAGFATYTNDEADEMTKSDLKALSETLGDKQFFFGDEPRSLDLKAFVYLALFLNTEKEVACPARDYAEEECKNLVGLFNRMKDRCWAEHWDEATGDKQELNPHIPKPEPPKEEEKKEEEKAEDKKEEEKKEEKEDKDKEKTDEKDNKDNE